MSPEREHPVESDDVDEFVGPPRWVKVFAAVAVALVVLYLALAVLLGGDHGPGRHGAEPGDARAESGVGFGRSAAAAFG